MPLHTHKILVIFGSEKKRALIFVEKCGRGGEIKKFGKMHKFAEICLLCQKREFFTIRTKMALARPILKLDL